MRPGPNGIRVKMIQHMVFTGGVHAGKPKGLRAVCEERFGVEAVRGMNKGVSSKFKSTKNTVILFIFF